MAPWEDRFDEITRRSEDVRRKMFIDSIREKNPSVDPTMVYLTPGEVLRAIDAEERIARCRSEIRSTNSPSGRKTALIYPDSERKPWTRGTTESLSYRNLFAALRNLNLESEIEVFALSPLLGIVPEGHFQTMPMYESSGLQSFMVKRRGLPWNQEDFKSVIARSSAIVSEFLKMHHGDFSEWHAVYRIPSIHERILQTVLDADPLPIWKHGSKRSLSESYLDVRKTIDGLKR